jgi:ABC-2 type transport system ATP-binding protein
MLSVSHFRKTFHLGLRRRPFVAARSISFDVQPGEVFGFLGPNGAGKTTTIKALLGLIRPDGGELSIFGRPVAERAWRAKVGYMPEHPNFYDYLSGLELVTWFARLTGLSAHEAEREANVLLDRVGLGHAKQRRLRSYSKGMLQRAGLAQAMVGAPQLLILDEPMTGLDPIGRKEIRELILSLRDEGKTIFYSTHILPDVELTCDRVSIIDKGVTLKTGRLDEILSETVRGVAVVVSGLPQAAQDALLQETRGKLHDGHLRAELPDLASAHAFLARAQGLGGQLLRFEPHGDDLESLFVRTLSGKGATAP